MHMQISSVAAESRNKSYDVIFILSCSAVERLWNDCWGATSTLRPPSLPHISHLLKQIVVVIAVKFVFNFFLSSSNETSNSKTFPPTSNEITLITVSEVFFSVGMQIEFMQKFVFVVFRAFQDASTEPRYQWHLDALFMSIPFSFLCGERGRWDCRETRWRRFPW